jgi:hypothetical protein
MNTVQLLRDAGPDGPALTTEARNAARAALLAEIDGARPRRARVPSRKVRWRIGVGVVAVAASWAAAVVIAAPDGPGTPADSVTLVDFVTPTFPLSLDPEPAGLRPAFDGSGDGATIAAYDDPTLENGFTIYVGEEEPEGKSPDDGAPGYEELDVDEIDLGNDEVEVVTYERHWCVEDTARGCRTEVRRFAWLSWERQDDQWVSILGHGEYADAGELREVAESLVDRPQRATLTAELAPQGWSVQFFKMGRVLTLVNDEFEQQTITVQVPLPEDVVPPEQLLDQLMAPIGPVIPVSVHGRPASLVRQDTGYVVDGESLTQWFLQAQFEDGTVYELQVPDAFTQEQVVQFAEAVTYHP